MVLPTCLRQAGLPTWRHGRRVAQLVIYWSIDPADRAHLTHNLFEIFIFDILIFFGPIAQLVRAPDS